MNIYFHQRIESLQYNTRAAITGTFSEKFYQKFNLFYKIFAYYLFA